MNAPALPRRGLLAGLLLAAALPALAQSYPTKPIRVIVPYAPGGVVDVQARAVTARMAVELGQPIVVEAKPGANGNIGAEFVARAPADGYTLLVSAPFLINNPLLEDHLRWAPKDFVPVARFTLSPSYFVVPASSPARSVRDFVEMARKSPTTLQFGDGGVGSTQNMANEMFKIAANIRLEAVTYKGAPPMVPDLINGAFAMAILPSTVAYPHVKSGAIRALANISSNRSAQLPDVPTIAEAGYPEVTALSWYAFHAPAGTPPAVMQRIEQAVRAALATDEVKERLVNAGGEAAFQGQEEFQAFLKSDAQRWERMVKAIRR
ncbi:tripartite tricarboxylate transporter substrate binding protein [Pseudacidovorax sp. RU35E]|uniref:tripartite tricarboxylate transporter substrate binding protein n=1 Tax=Pseudacidovorax sp. RU35E TaxID=1907403 RepID=UPI000953A0EE|nr:tripartite tricarboxylate transporter substrate binding protein [Pseudacidovorax sp. RU35E]SIR30172.1 Tripartite-type tricarboxylate transporter, receptor component TctC [Pseudacidovorax sp. RU35E]